MSAESTELKKLLAYNDFRAMPAGQRSIDALWREYVRRNREGDDVPTTNRSTLYQWAKEKQWQQRLLQEEQEAQQAEREAFLAERQRTIHAMFAIFREVALPTWKKLIEGAEDETVQARLILGLADRVGFVAESRTAAAKRALDTDIAEHAPAPAPLPAPPETDDDAAWAEYARQQMDASR